MGFVDKAVQALLGSDLLVNFVLLDGSKFADITHADTNEHTLTPAVLGVPDNTLAVQIVAHRVTGTGHIRLYRSTGGTSIHLETDESAFWPIDVTGVFRYSLSAANDDWDIHAYAVVVQGRLLG